jgi:hypothetical protein
MPKLTPNQIKQLETLAKSSYPGYVSLAKSLGLTNKEMLAFLKSGSKS